MPGKDRELTRPETGEAKDSFTRSDLAKRNKELREITDTLAKQSVNLLRLRNELSAEKQKLETVIHGMADGMAYFNVYGKLEIINRVAEKLIPEEHNITENSFEQFANQINLRNESKEDGEYDVCEVEMNSRVVRVRSSTISSEEGGASGTLILLTDITKEKEYESLKEDFANMISHELRTPLTSIRAAVDNLIQGNLGPVNDEQKKFLELVIRNTDRQQSLVNELLDLAKLEKGMHKLLKEPSDLAVLAGFAVLQFSFAFKDKGVSLETDFKQDFPLVDVDQKLFTQALNNLFSNALKFTDSGGCVTVSLSDENKNGINYACVSVADTGIGLEGGHDMIFDKYVQVNGSRQRRYSGTGLGLPICKEIAKAHDGWIAVDSKLGVGSCFKICFPYDL